MVARLLVSFGTADEKVWYDLLNPTTDEIKTVESGCHLKLPSREKLSEVETSSRVSEASQVFYLSMPVVASAVAIDEAPSPVGFVLSEKALVTIRYTALRSFEAAAAQFSESTRPSTGAEAFASLIDQMVDSSADLLEKIGGELDVLARTIFPVRQGRRQKPKTNNALRNTLADVGIAGERLSRVRDSMLGLQRIVPYVIGANRPWIGEATIDALKSAHTDLLSLRDYETHLYGKVQFLLDAVLGFITTKQNEIFTVLTVVSVIGIPPTLVASIYGMNFKHMPELDWVWGYPFALGLILLSTILPLLWFKWRGWF